MSGEVKYTVLVFQRFFLVFCLDFLLVLYLFSCGCWVVGMVWIEWWLYNLVRGGGVGRVCAIKKGVWCGCLLRDVFNQL